ncbi:MAG TPA: phosphodiester glycosidase family protein [Acidimicrobiales bacterium]|nr:phosphodiester glycosidase family protein [Acidimicrobiales bacterium]
MRRIGRSGVVAVVLALLAPVSMALGDPGGDRHHQVAPGVSYTELRRSPGLVAHVARIAPNSGFELRPVLAHDLVDGGGRQATSELCRRAGGVVCVNADFAACPTCRQPYGGVVADGRVLRTPHHAHEQVTITGDGPTSAQLAWGGQLVVEQVWRAPLSGPLLNEPEGEGLELRRERRVLPLGGLNVGPMANGAVLFTPDWGPVTPSPVGHLEVVLATAGPVMPGVVGADLGGQRDGGGPVPPGGAVVSANGEAAADLQALADEWRQSDATEKTLVVETALSLGAVHSVGGHPVLLRDGQRQSWWTGDAKAQGRHPRTLLGWTPSGETLLVVADGRAPGHSAGLTLEEAADLLAELGASDGINLDGGGSSTFVGTCDVGPCVLNRPSDGRERLVPIALALVGDAPVQPMSPAPAPPLAPPGPPPADDPASTAHVPEPEPEPEPPPEAPAASQEPEASPSADDGSEEADLAVAAPAPVVVPRPSPLFDRWADIQAVGRGTEGPAPGDRPAGDTPWLPAVAATALVAGVAGGGARLRQRNVV